MIPASRIRFIELIFILLAVMMPGYGQAAANSPSVHITGFHLVSPTEGWVLTDSFYGTKDITHLYWTKDSSQTWTDIMPPNTSGMRMKTVTFVDNQQGSAIFTTEDLASFHAIYTIARTKDGGNSWEMKPLNASLTWYPADMSLQWLDLHTGWLRVREQSSSNFDIGELVKTTDGGDTWIAVTLPVDFNSPVGDPFILSPTNWGGSPVERGGGAVEQNLLYRTQDGGQTWQTRSVGVLPSGIWLRAYQLPQFVNAQEGLLTVQDLSNDLSRNNSLEVYTTHDSGATWQLDTTLDGSRPVRWLDSTLDGSVKSDAEIAQVIVDANVLENG